MNLFVGLFYCYFLCLVASFDIGNRNSVSNQTLRGLYDQRKTAEIRSDMEAAYGGIYQSIVESATRGNTDFRFSVKCDRPNYQTNVCDYRKGKQLFGSSVDVVERNGHHMWLEGRSDDVINKYKLSMDEYTTDIVKWIQETFPESTITSEFKDCCNRHTIRW
jgi:hypothetical protein